MAAHQDLERRTLARRSEPHQLVVRALVRGQGQGQGRTASDPLDPIAGLTPLDQQAFEENDRAAPLSPSERLTIEIYWITSQSSLLPSL